MNKKAIEMESLSVTISARNIQMVLEYQVMHLQGIGLALLNGSAGACQQSGNMQYPLNLVCWYCIGQVSMGSTENWHIGTTILSVDFVLAKWARDQRKIDT